MKWYKIKEKLPNSGDIVIIKVKYSQPYICCARFLDNLSTWDGCFKNIFIVIVHPRFPKPWLLSDQYKKISRIPKSKIEEWTKIEIFNDL